MERLARDIALLDALDAFDRTSFEGFTWRVIREGRDVLQGYPAKARWDPGTFDVLYTSLEREGALAEIYFHLNRQPVFPSKLRSVLYKLRVKTTRTLRLDSLEILEPLGVAKSEYPDQVYTRTQEIGDAAAFLGFDGMVVPSARSHCLNLILFTDRLEPDDLVEVESESVDWNAWGKR